MFCLISACVSNILKHIVFRRKLFTFKSVIVNRAYLSDVKFKSNVCKLFEPHDKIKLTVSRGQLIKMRKTFEIQ